MSTNDGAIFFTQQRILMSSRLTFIERIAEKLRLTKKLLPSPDEERLYKEALGHLVHVLSTKRSPVIQEDFVCGCEADGHTKIGSKREKRMEEILSKLKCLERKRLYDPPADSEIGYYRLIKKYIRSISVFFTSQKIMTGSLPKLYYDKRFDCLTLYNELHYLEELEEGNIHMSHISANIASININNGYDVNPLLGLGMADVDEKTQAVSCGSKEINNMFYHHKFRIALLDLMSSHHAFSPPYSEEKKCYEQLLDHIAVLPVQQPMTGDDVMSVYSDHLRYVFLERLLSNIRTLEKHCENVAKDIIAKLSIPDSCEKLLGNCIKDVYTEDKSEAVLSFMRELHHKCEVSPSDLLFHIEAVDRSLQIAYYMRGFIRCLLPLNLNVCSDMDFYYYHKHDAPTCVVNLDWQALHAFTLFKNGCSFPVNEFQEKDMLKNQLAPCSKMESQAVLTPQDEGTKGEDEKGNVKILKGILEEFRAIGDLCLEALPSCKEDQILNAISRSVTSSAHFFLCAMAYEQKTRVDHHGEKIPSVRRTGRKRKRDVEVSNLESWNFRVVQHFEVFIDLLRGYKDGFLQKLKNS